VHGRLAILVLAGLFVPASGVAAATSLEPTAAPGSIGIRLIDVSRNARGDPLVHAYIVGRLAPATSVTRRVEVTNNTRSIAVVAVYPAAASFLRGRFGWAPGHTRNELSSWTTVNRGVLRLAPGAAAVESVTIDVPGDASPGERYAVLWAEVSAPGPATGGVTIVNRVGVRMYLSTGSGGLPASNFAVGSLSAERSKTGHPLVVAMVNNDGGGRLEISGSLTLSKGPGGLRAGPFPVSLGAPLAPGASKQAIVQLDKRVPDGPWHAKLQLTSGRVERIATATIRFPQRAAGGHPMLRAFLAVIGVAGLIGIAALAAFVSRRRRRGGGDLHPVWSGAGSP
jgi:hypothetical protein